MKKTDESQTPTDPITELASALQWSATYTDARKHTLLGNAVHAVVKALTHAPAWTSTPSTEPGYYWCRIWGDDDTCRVVKIEPDGVHFSVCGVKGQHVFDTNELAQLSVKFWPVPIQKPEGAK